MNRIIEQIKEKKKAKEVFWGVNEVAFAFEKRNCWSLGNELALGYEEGGPKASIHLM